MKERTIVINGFSKAFAMTGWRLGYILADRRLVKQMLKIHQYVIMCASSMSQYAGIEALKKGLSDDFSAVEKMVREYDRRRKYVLARLRAMGLPCFEPEGAFYAFPEIKGTGLTSEEFCTRLLREKSVAMVPALHLGNRERAMCAYPMPQPWIRSRLRWIAWRSLLHRYIVEGDLYGGD